MKNSIVIGILCFFVSMALADPRIEAGGGADVCHVPYESDTSFASYLGACRAIIRRSGDLAKGSFVEIHPSVQAGYLPPDLAAQADVEGESSRRITNIDAPEPCVLIGANILFHAPNWVARTTVERTASPTVYKVTYRLNCWGGVRLE